MNSADLAHLSEAQLCAGIIAWRDAAEYGDLQKALLMARVSVLSRFLRIACDLAGVAMEPLLHGYLAGGSKSLGAKLIGALTALADCAANDPKVTNCLCSMEAHEFRDFRKKLAGTDFLRRFEAFLRRYGHRGNQELDWSMPRYSEEPGILLFSIQQQLATRSGVTRSTPPSHEAPLLQGGILALIIRYLLKTTKATYLWRETERSEWIRTVAAIRRWHLALAERFVVLGWLSSPKDYFLLHFAEIEAVVSSRMTHEEVTSLLAERQREYEIWRGFNAPMLLKGTSHSVSPAESRPPVRLGNDNQLHGLCVSAGFVEGQVIILRSAAEFSRMCKGEIIVAPAADPSWFPLFGLASGLILEIGGLLSHSATVARECRLPALANVRGATALLKDGDRVRLDATGGYVEVI